jgi:transcriptional regulator with XRE-family HTH domain
MSKHGIITDVEAFGRRLRHLIEIHKEKTGKSAHQMSKDMYMDGAYFNKLKNGKVRPGSEIIKRFANYFGVSEDVLLEKKEDESAMGRNVVLSEADIKGLVENFRKALKSKADKFTAPYSKDPDHPLEFVTGYCYYLLKYLESQYGVKLLTAEDDDMYKKRKGVEQP